MADNTYAELCVVKAAVLAKIPKGLDLVQAAALPLVTVTGNQLICGYGNQGGPDGFGCGCCWKCGAFGGIHWEGTRGDCDRRGVEEADRMRRRLLARIRCVATDDDTAIANLPLVDAVADTVGGRTSEKLIAKVKPGGVYSSVVGLPQNAAKYPSVKIVHSVLEVR